MGIVINRQVNDQCKLGVWKITEDFHQLLSRLRLDNDDRATLLNFKNPKRKLEWLAVRVLLDQLTGKENKILYNGNRRPYLLDQDYNISISHSDQYTTVLLCKEKHVGIDIEKMQSKIEHIAFKFLSEKEMESLDARQKIYHLYLHWCAKEALFKVCNRKQVSFRQHLFIEPFTPLQEGTLTGRVETAELQFRLKMHYFSVENYPLVWCYKE
jgi:4'-phosphopantetheinyl transferase EntD